MYRGWSEDLVVCVLVGLCCAPVRAMVLGPAWIVPSSTWPNAAFGDEPVHNVPTDAPDEGAIADFNGDGLKEWICAGTCAVWGTAGRVVPGTGYWCSSQLRLARGVPLCPPPRAASDVLHRRGWHLAVI
jgi:hypothetical protein